MCPSQSPQSIPHPLIGLADIQGHLLALLFCHKLVCKFSFNFMSHGGQLYDNLLFTEAQIAFQEDAKSLSEWRSWTSGPDSLRLWHGSLTTRLHCLEALTSRTSVFADHREVLDALQIRVHVSGLVQGAWVRSRLWIFPASAPGRASPLGKGIGEKWPWGQECVFEALYIRSQ